MADVRRSLNCLIYSLRKLAINPKCIIVFALLYIHMKDSYQGLIGFLADYDETINAFGLFINMISDPHFVMIAGIGLMLIFSDAPFFDDAQQYILIRAKKGPWIAGQIFCVLLATAVYLLIMLGIQHLILHPYLTYDNQWGRAIHTLSRTDLGDNYDLLVGFHRDYMRMWSVRRCFALGMILRWGAYATCALIIFIINILSTSKAGIFAAIFILLFDLFMDFGVSATFYVLSISSLARLPLLNMGTNPYFPRVELAMSVLWGSFLVAVALAWITGRRVDLIYSASEN